MMMKLSSKRFGSVPSIVSISDFMDASLRDWTISATVLSTVAEKAFRSAFKLVFVTCPHVTHSELVIEDSGGVKKHDGVMHVFVVTSNAGGLKSRVALVEEQLVSHTLMVFAVVSKLHSLQGPVFKRNEVFPLFSMVFTSSHVLLTTLFEFCTVVKKRNEGTSVFQIFIVLSKDADHTSVAKGTTHVTQCECAAISLTNSSF